MAQEIILLDRNLLEDPMSTIAEFYQSKKWFELGDAIIDLFSREATIPYREIIFLKFIRGFFEFLDPFHRAKIVLAVCQALTPLSKGLDFLEQVLPRFKEFPEQADLLRLQIVNIKTLQENYDEALQLLNEIESQINESSALCLRSSFHHNQCFLDRARGDFDAFYSHVLLYLSTSRNTEDPDLAYDMCKAALCGSTVCSFGELASHPILRSLESTPNEWLAKLIHLLDEGSPETIAIFNEKFVPIIQDHSSFQEYLPVITNKMSLAVFLQLLFSRQYDSRVLSFQEISAACNLDINQVELLVMKALSAELIRGYIDQVAEIVVVTWCKPKTLGINGLKFLKSQIDRWAEIIHQQRHLLSDESQPIIG